MFEVSFLFRARVYRLQKDKVLIEIFVANLGSCHNPRAVSSFFSTLVRLVVIGTLFIEQASQVLKSKYVCYDATKNLYLVLNTL